MADRPQKRSSFGGYLIASAGVGVAGGLALGAALLAADVFGLYSLIAAGSEAPTTMALFALGLGALLGPVGLATALALPLPGDRDAARQGTSAEHRGNPGPVRSVRSVTPPTQRGIR
jgi:nitroreductase